MRRSRRCRNLGRAGSGPYKRIRTDFENAVRAAGLEDFTFHGCRHHFASWFNAHLSPGHLRAEMQDGNRRGRVQHKIST